jgi:methylated-DNA-[protein]-cysteine S-methyltransferase
MEYFIFNTDMGWVGLLASSKGLMKVTLPQKSVEKAFRSLGNGANQANWAPSQFDDIVGRLRAYFSGYRVSFPDELDLSLVTPFQRQVFKATALIPYSETRSYQWVAQAMDRPEAARAVGQALARNPLPVIIPCHRVVRSDGGLGGFTGGLETKKLLLDLELAKPAK